MMWNTIRVIVFPMFSPLGMHSRRILSFKRHSSQSDLHSFSEEISENGALVQGNNMNVISNSMFDRMVPSFLEKQTESFLAESEQETALAFDEKVYNDKDTIQGLVKNIGEDFKTLINPTGGAGGQEREIADLIPHYNGTDLPYLGPFEQPVQNGGPRMYDAMFSIGVRAYKLYWEAQIKNEFPSAKQTTIRQKHWSALIGRHDAHDLGFQNSASASVRKPFFSVNRFLRYLNAGNLIQGAQIAANQQYLEAYYLFIKSDEPARHDEWSYRLSVQDKFWYNETSRYFYHLLAFNGGSGDPGANPIVDTQKKMTMQRLLMGGHDDKRVAPTTSLFEEAVRSFQLGILPMNVFLCGLAHMGVKGFLADNMFSDFYGPHGIVDKYAFWAGKFQNRASSMWFHRWLNNDYNHKDSPCDPSRSSDEGYMVDGFCQMSTEKSAMRKGHASYDLHSLLQNVLDAEPFPDAMRLSSASPAGIDLHNKIYYDVHCWVGPKQHQILYCGIGVLCAGFFLLYCCCNWFFNRRCTKCRKPPPSISLPTFDASSHASPTLFRIRQCMMVCGGLTCLTRFKNLFERLRRLSWCRKDREENKQNDMVISLAASGVIPVCCLPPIKAKETANWNFHGENISVWNSIQKDILDFYPAPQSTTSNQTGQECGDYRCLVLLTYLIRGCKCLFDVGAGFILVYFMLRWILTDVLPSYNNGCDRAGYSLYILDENADLYVYILQRGSDSFHDWEANTAMREGVFSFLSFYGFFHSFLDAVPVAGSLYDKIHGAGSSRPFLEVYGGVADYYNNSQTYAWIENTVLNAVRSINNLRHKRHAGKSPGGSKTAGFKTLYNVAGQSLGGALAELASFHLQIAKRHDAETKTKEQDNFILPPGPTSLFAFSAPAIFFKQGTPLELVVAWFLHRHDFARAWLDEADLCHRLAHQERPAPRKHISNAQ